VRFVVGEIHSLALVVTISPINVIPVILPLLTTRPLFNALCHLAGFIAGVAGLPGACVAIAGAVNLSPSSNHSTWAGILKLAPRGTSWWLGSESSVVGLGEARHGAPRGCYAYRLPASS